MKKVQHSSYIAELRPVAGELLEKLLGKYEYASVLVTDSQAMAYRIGRSGVSVSENNRFGSRGVVVKVYDKGGYGEYSLNDLSQDNIDSTVSAIESRVMESLGNVGEGFAQPAYPALPDEAIVLKKETEYEIHPTEMGDDGIIERLSAIRESALKLDERLLDVITVYQYQQYHKLFLSKSKDMEQSVLYSNGAVMMAIAKGEEVKQNYKGFSNLGGAELLNKMEAAVPSLVTGTADLLRSEPITPGVYDCICSPDTTGMIVHEAFGHGVEMDMFVKDRALARDYIGKYVASPLITMHDGCGVNDSATYFFDDEGTLSHDTVVIDKGILVAGISDAQSAMHLGTVPTGNGRRESYSHKAYTRMTNTYFAPGTHKVEDMIASIEYGMLLENPTSGMEDPKNWGIQCMVNVAREIKNGKLTGRIFSPIVLTGYVPDLLCSISMVSDTFETCGSGACGKGHKEWVKVSDGGPYIKAKVRLG